MKYLLILAIVVNISCYDPVLTSGDIKYCQEMCKPNRGLKRIDVYKTDVNTFTCYCYNTAEFTNNKSKDDDKDGFIIYE